MSARLLLLPSKQLDPGHDFYGGEVIASLPFLPFFSVLGMGG